MALLFDGIDDRAMTESIAGIPVAYPFTLGALFTRAVTGGIHVVMATGSGTLGTGGVWRLVIQASGALRIAIGSAGFNSSLIIPTGVPCFAAVACLDATNRRFFTYRYDTRVEGTEFNGNNLTVNPNVSPRLKVGCISQDDADTVFANFFNGTLTWLGIWDRYLGSAGDGYDSLRALAHLGPRCMGKPAFLAEFLEGQGSVVYDRSGNGNHANMSNFSASPWIDVGQPGPWWARRASRRVSYFIPSSNPFYYRRYVLDRHRRDDLGGSEAL